MLAPNINLLESTKKSIANDVDDFFSEGSASAFDGTEQIIDDPYDFLEKDDLLERLISLEHETTLKQVVMEKNY